MCHKVKSVSSFYYRLYSAKVRKCYKLVGVVLFLFLKMLWPLHMQYFFLSITILLCISFVFYILLFPVSGMRMI